MKNAISAPKVSVIVPIYNVEKYIDKALGSLNAQSCEDIEVICINNGSTDSSKKIIEDYQHKDPRFVMLSHDRKSIGEVRNEGIRLSKGKYIAFIDSDDTFEKDALKKLYEQSEQQNADMILYNYKDVDEDYIPIPNGQKNIAKHVGNSINGIKTFTWHSLKSKIFGIDGKFWGAWSKFFNSDFLKKNNIQFSDCNLCEDHIFTVESLLKAKKIGYLADYIYNYMKRQTSTSRQIVPSDNNFCIIDVFQNVKNLLENLNLQDTLHSEFNEYVDTIHNWALPRIVSKDEFSEKCKNIKFLPKDTFENNTNKI